MRARRRQRKGREALRRRPLPDRWRGSGGGSSGGARRRCGETRERGRVRSDASSRVGRTEGKAGRGRRGDSIPAAGSRAERDPRNATRARPQAASVARGDACARAARWWR